MTTGRLRRHSRNSSDGASFGHLAGLNRGSAPNMIQFQLAGTPPRGRGGVPDAAARHRGQARRAGEWASVPQAQFWQPARSPVPILRQLSDSAHELVTPSEPPLTTRAPPRTRRNKSRAAESCRRAGPLFAHGVRPGRERGAGKIGLGRTPAVPPGGRAGPPRTDPPRGAVSAQSSSPLSLSRLTRSDGLTQRLGSNR